MGDPEQEVTRLLTQLRDGNDAAVHQLLPLVYKELHRVAAGVFRNQNPADTLQPTALVNEAWLKLAGNLDSVKDRHHFLVVAGMAMRQVIANHARDKLTERRGGTLKRVTLDTSLAGAQQEGIAIVDLDDSLRALAEHNERHAKVAELRLFSGLSIEETAQALDVSTRTVDSDWAMAKAWLTQALDARR